MEKINVCIIPARGGSKGVQRKNIRELAGKPLIAWTIISARKARAIDKVVVSTEDNEIADVAQQYGAEVHWRSEENAKDSVHTIHAVLECLYFYEKRGIIIKNVAMLLATSPLRTNLDIDTALTLLDRGNCDSVISVSKFDKPISSLRWMDDDEIMEPIVEVDHFEVQRQDIKKPLFIVNGSIFVSSPKHLKEVESFHKGRVKGYVMSKNTSIDINDMADWTMAEALLGK
jgi:CMP-N-acetylneuraminic acid synthetase